MVFDQRGGALLAVLWLSAALAAIGFSLANTVRGETERTTNSVEGLRAYYVATGAIDRALMRAVWNAQYGIPVYAASPYKAGLPVMPMSFPAGDAVVEVIPETSKFDVNTALPEEILKVFMALGLDPARAMQATMGLVNLRTPSTFRRPPASIQEIEELLLMPGMTPDLFYGMYGRIALQPGGPTRFVPRGGARDCFSVYGTTQLFDINTAHPAVLAAIGAPLDFITLLAERRRIAPIASHEEFSRVAQGAGPAGSRLALYNDNSSVYTLRATGRARAASGRLLDTRRTVAALVKLLRPGGGTPYIILRWYDNAWSDLAWN